MGMRFDTWNKLSPADQKIINELSIWAADLQGKAWNAGTEQTIQICKKRGIEFIELLPATAEARWILQDDSVVALIDRMDGTYQVQFLRALAKQQPALLREKQYAALVKRHAAASVASR